MPSLGGPFLFNGIDRTYNSGSYTLDNVKTCCKNCNSMKKDLSPEEFLNIINLIHNNLKNK